MADVTEDQLAEPFVAEPTFKDVFDERGDRCTYAEDETGPDCGAPAMYLMVLRGGGKVAEVSSCADHVELQRRFGNEHIVSIRTNPQRPRGTT